MYNSLPVSATFMVIGLLIITHAIKTRKDKKKSLTFDEILLGSFHIIMSFLLPIIYSKYPLAVNSLFFVTNFFVGLTLLIITGLVMREKIRVKWNPSIKLKRTYENFRDQFMASHGKRNEYKRRVTHIIPVAVILPIYLIGKALAMVNPQWEAWCVCLIITIGASFVLFFSIGDLVRIKKPHLLPEWTSKLFTTGLNKEEIENNTFTTTSAMVLGFAPWILAGLQVFTIVALVASVSDAMAAITGFRFGRRKFPRQSKKTVEGYIGGILTTFGLVVLMFFVLSKINPLYILIIGSLAALTFFLVDFINLPIDDNKINPHAIGLVLLTLLAAI